MHNLWKIIYLCKSVAGAVVVTITNTVAVAANNYLLTYLLAYRPTTRCVGITAVIVRATDTFFKLPLPTRARGSPSSLATFELPKR